MNVDIIGNVVIVYALPEQDTPMIYLGNYKTKGWNFKPTRPWVQESIEKAGIDVPIEWREHVDLLENTKARNWLAWKMDIDVSQIQAEFWTRRRILEFVKFKFIRHLDSD